MKSCGLQNVMVSHQSKKIIQIILRFALLEPRTKDCFMMFFNQDTRKTPWTLMNMRLVPTNSVEYSQGHLQLESNFIGIGNTEMYLL